MTFTAQGEWPGTDFAEAVRIIFGELGRPGDIDPAGVPFVPQLPARGLGADQVGHAAALLADLHIDAQPHGWRLVDRPGLDEGRTARLQSRDIDRLAENAADYSGRLKIQVLGPWSLAARLWLSRGDRVIADTGARRDVLQSYAEGVDEYAARIREILPAAWLTVQLDETVLDNVLDGRIPTVSGFGRIPPVPPREVEAGLAGVIERLAADNEHVIVDATGNRLARRDHGENRSLVGLLADAGATAVAAPVQGLDSGGWEAVAEIVERGVRFRPVVDAAGRHAAEVRGGIDAIRTQWHELGMPTSGLADLDLVAASAPDDSARDARAGLDYVRAVARGLYEAAFD
ncbi:uroporphyrinogen decarboxylase/cobalamine-independent methonine synthase family protein [Spelaeicoccus albus]|uniref:Cobalamin-independent methionine synthase catalytic subunit n=1 Tax=Spelaeicoccus albus TaxID=1280376 RepID=A0A7Z0IHA9_9MICO|nr:methionine synthase [Spelaeicoccus albus]NYI67625.1 hypothetical protein [Spelaeicoccus albus]